MAADEQPDWVTGLRVALEKTAYVRTAQRALAWMLRGDMEQARKALADLPIEQLRAVSVAAAALASLADEVAMEWKP